MWHLQLHCIAAFQIANLQRPIAAHSASWQAPCQSSDLCPHGGRKARPNSRPHWSCLRRPLAILVISLFSQLLHFYKVLSGDIPDQLSTSARVKDRNIIINVMCFGSIKSFAHIYIPCVGGKHPPGALHGRHSVMFLGLEPIATYLAATDSSHSTTVGAT